MPMTQLQHKAGAWVLERAAHHSTKPRDHVHRSYTSDAVRHQRHTQAVWMPAHSHGRVSHWLHYKGFCCNVLLVLCQACSSTSVQQTQAKCYLGCNMGPAQNHCQLKQRSGGATTIVTCTRLVTHTANIVWYSPSHTFFAVPDCNSCVNTNTPQ
jgi:hypothetical protein